MAHRAALRAACLSIELIGVSKRHGAETALDGVDLRVAAGEFVALIGPSGSGKTTLLRVVAGLDRGYQGGVRIGGADVSRLPARDRRIGFVFQNYALFRHMTVAENVAFGLRVRPRAERPPRTRIAARVAELLALVQLRELAARYPDQLSGGQRQRVALARALAIDPSVLLLDEPFGALDPPIRVELRAILRGLHARLGLTTILVTHDREEAFELADRIALLRAGRVEQLGTAEALESSPASAFVFDFLGEGAQLPGLVRDGRFAFDRLPFASLPTECRAGPATALVRPNEIVLTAGDGPGRVAGIQRRVRFTHYVVELAGLRLHVEAPGPPLAGLAVGDPCQVALAYTRVIPDGSGIGVGRARAQRAAEGLVLG